MLEIIRHARDLGKRRDVCLAELETIAFMMVEHGLDPATVKTTSLVWPPGSRKPTGTRYALTTGETLTCEGYCQALFGRLYPDGPGRPKRGGTW